MAETTLFPVIMAVIAGVSVTYAILSRRTQCAADIARDLADYKTEQAEKHTKTDENIKTMTADIHEIKESLKRMEAKP